MKRVGLASGSGQRTRYFFNGLTEEVTKVSVDGAHSDAAFQRYVKWGHAATSTTGDGKSRLIGIDGKAGDFDEGYWARLRHVRRGTV